MLTKVELRIPGDSAVTTMDVAVPQGSPYLVHNIDGLGPVKASISTSTLALLDGVSVDSTRIDQRNIVIDFEYRPSYTQNQSVFNLRQALYKIAGPGKEVELTFVIQGVGTRKIVGRVESVESPMFSSELIGQLSVICPVPYFIGARRTYTGRPSTNEVINYEGDIPAGIDFGHTLEVTSQNHRLRRSHPSTGWQDLALTGMLAANIGVIFNTNDRQKAARTWQGTNLIPNLTSFNWWKLLPGNNTIQFSGSGPNGSLPTGNTFSLTYDVLYGGL